MSQGVRKVGPKVVMDGLSAATNQSVAVDVGDVTSITCMFWWDTGSSLVGAFEIDILRRAKGVDGETDDEWHPITLSPAVTVSGASGQADAVLSGDVRKICVRYVATTGTGNVYAAFSATTRG
jgi:hypothetical protein